MEKKKIILGMMLSVVSVSTLFGAQAAALEDSDSSGDEIREEDGKIKLLEERARALYARFEMKTRKKESDFRYLFSTEDKREFLSIKKEAISLNRIDYLNDFERALLEKGKVVNSDFTLPDDGLLSRTCEYVSENPGKAVAYVGLAALATYGVAQAVRDPKATKEFLTRNGGKALKAAGCVTQ